MAGFMAKNPFALLDEDGGDAPAGGVPAPKGDKGAKATPAPRSIAPIGKMVDKPCECPLRP
jgi:hypothetical protein